MQAKCTIESSMADLVRIARIAMFERQFTTDWYFKAVASPSEKKNRMLKELADHYRRQDECL